MFWTKREKRPFIFVIGFNRTATRALHILFEGNGYRSIHWDSGKLVRTMVENLVSGKKILSGYDTRYEVFSDFIFVNHSADIQGNGYFKVMDRDYPGSYLLFNNRNTEDWIRSRAASGLRKVKNSYLARSMMVNNTKDPEVVFNNWRSQKMRFEADVRTYFEGRDNFVEFDIDKDDVVAAINNLLNVELKKAHWKTVGKKVKGDYKQVLQSDMSSSTDVRSDR